MKILIKKNNKNFLEEARTFEDATTNVGKYKKKLINKLRTLEKEQPEQLADEIIENMKNSIIENYRVEGKNYALPDGERVAVFDWLKNLTINNTNDLIGILSKGELDDTIKMVLARFILSKKFTGVKSVAELEDLVDLDVATGDAWRQWKEIEQRKKEKKSLKSSDQNIDELASPDQNWEIVIPQDKQAAIYLGQICRSHWCTSARSGENMFSMYHKEDDPLFILKHKTKKETAEVKNPQTHEMEEVSVPLMFQVHFGTKQFMNRKDDSVEEDEIFVTLLELVKNSKTADGKSIEEKYPIVGTVSAFKTEKGIQKRFVDSDNGVIEWFLNGERHREDGPALEETSGTKEWYLNGKPHREDGPAKEWSDGYKGWFINGKAHREDGPAEEYRDGTKRWAINGKNHRTDGPAIEKDNGESEWFINGERHREDGPAVIHADGSKEWYLNGRRHRKDGPAIEWPSGHKEWYLNGERHREDGPAIEEPTGFKAWYLNGKRHREDGPAALNHTGQTWYLDNRLLSSTKVNDLSTPPRFIEAGGKEWDWQNDPWFDKSKIKTELKEHFQRFRKLWI